MYITSSDLYSDEDLSSVLYLDADVTARILLAQAIIESITKKWFEARARTYYVDGDGTDELVLPAPIVTITSVERQRSATGFDTLLMSDFAVYNAHPDDWNHPAIAIANFDYQLDVQSEITRFPRGKRNIRVIGTFGWLDASGATPEDIKMATKLLTKTYLGKVGDETMQADLKKFGIKRRETDDHEVEYFAHGAVGRLTGNVNVDRLLVPYTMSNSSSVV